MALRAFFISGLLIAACAARAAAGEPAKDDKTPAAATQTTSAAGEPTPKKPAPGDSLVLDQGWRDPFSCMPRPGKVEKPPKDPNPKENGGTPGIVILPPSDSDMEIAAEKKLAEARGKIADLKFGDAASTAKGGLEDLKHIPEAEYKHKPWHDQLRLVHDTAAWLQDQQAAHAEFNQMSKKWKVSGLVWKEEGGSQVVINDQVLAEGTAIELPGAQKGVRLVVEKIGRDQILFAFRGYKFTMPVTMELGVGGENK
jgi:hypothetical protein